MNLTESQYQTLKGAYPTYEFFILNQSVNGGHPGTMNNLYKMEEVSKENGRPPTNMRCGTCVADLMKNVYERSNYKEWALLEAA